MAETWKGDENQNGATGPHYLVHYQGWKKTWDEWVPESRLLKFTDENVAQQKALVNAHKAEAAAAAAVAAAASKERDTTPRRSGPAKAPGAPSSSRGSKRSRESHEPDEHERRPELHLVLPEALKAQLVDDWENVTRKEQLVPLPRTPNVKQILADYAAHYAAQEHTRPRAPAVLQEVLAGLKLYFDKSLAQNLLYRYERPQYVEMRKRHGPKMGDGDVAAAKPSERGGSAAPADAPPSLDLEASELYGAEHLLRLFGTRLCAHTVNLSGMIAQTSMDSDSLALLREHLTEFLSFLAVEHARYFVREYEEPSPAYLRLSAM